MKRWNRVLSVCDEQRVPFEVIIFPDRHRDDWSVDERANVLCQLRKEGWKVRELMIICPISERSIRRALKKSQK